MYKLKLAFFAALMVLLMSCKSDDTPTSPPQIEGRKMLLMGNSFFRPNA